MLACAHTAAVLVLLVGCSAIDLCVGLGAGNKDHWTAPCPEGYRFIPRGDVYGAGTVFWDGGVLDEQACADLCTNDLEPNCVDPGWASNSLCDGKGNCVSPRCLNPGMFPDDARCVSFGYQTRTRRCSLNKLNEPNRLVDEQGRHGHGSTRFCSWICPGARYKNHEKKCTFKRTTCPPGQCFTPGVNTGRNSEKTRDDTKCTDSAPGLFKKGTSTANSCDRKKTWCPPGQYFTPGRNSEKTRDDTKCTDCAPGLFKKGTSTATVCDRKKTRCPPGQYFTPGRNSEKTRDDTECMDCAPGQFKKTSTTCAAMCNGQFDPDDPCGEKTEADCTGDLESVREVVRKACPVLCDTCETKSCPTGDEDDPACRSMHPADCHGSTAMQADCPVLCDVCDTTCAPGEYKDGDSTACTPKKTADNKGCADDERFVAGDRSNKTADDTSCAPCPDDEFKKTSTTCAAMCNGKFDPDEMCGEKTKADCDGGLQELSERVRKNCPVLCDTCETKSCPNGEEDDPACRYMHPAECNSTDDSLSSSMQAGCPALCKNCTTWCPPGEYKDGNSTTCTPKKEADNKGCADDQRFVAGDSSEMTKDDTSCVTCPNGHHRSNATTCTPKKTADNRNCADDQRFVAGKDTEKTKDDTSCAPCPDGEFKENSATCSAICNGEFVAEVDPPVCKNVAEAECRGGSGVTISAKCRILCRTKCAPLVCDGKADDARCATGVQKDDCNHQFTGEQTRAECPTLCGGCATDQPDDGAGAGGNGAKGDDDDDDDDDEDMAMYLTAAAVAVLVGGAVLCALCGNKCSDANEEGAAVSGSANKPNGTTDSYGNATATAASVTNVYGDLVDGGARRWYDVGAMPRTAAEQLLLDRAYGSNDFLVRESKGAQVITIAKAPGRYIHNTMEPATGSPGMFVVNSKMVAGNSVDAMIQRWLASPAEARADLGCSISDHGQKNTGNNTYGSGDGDGDVHGSDVAAKGDVYGELVDGPGDARQCSADLSFGRPSYSEQDSYAMAKSYGMRETSNV